MKTFAPLDMVLASSSTQVEGADIGSRSRYQAEPNRTIHSMRVTAVYVCVWYAASLGSQHLSPTAQTATTSHSAACSFAAKSCRQCLLAIIKAAALRVAAGRLLISCTAAAVSNAAKPQQSMLVVQPSAASRSMIADQTTMHAAAGDR